MRSLPSMNTKPDTNCQKLRKGRYLTLPNFSLFFNFIPSTLPTIVDTPPYLIAGGLEWLWYFIQIL